jgi:pimeloyl-ACP methyl ester carboxylesterase
LYAGRIASAYAPELHLFGIVAAVPPTRLDLDLRNIMGNVGGRVIASYALEDWSQLYGASVSGITNPKDIPVEELVARLCLENLVGNGRLIARIVLTPRMLLPAFWTAQPWTRMAAENSADPHSLGVPALIFQGTADGIVMPATTAAFVRAACAAGNHVDFVWLAGGDHTNAGFDSAAPALQWMGQRFDEPSPPAPGCTTRTMPAESIWQLLLELRLSRVCPVLTIVNSGARLGGWKALPHA